MVDSDILLGLPALVLFLGAALGQDVPCDPRPGAPGEGQICVCNSSYCDTVGRPARLPRGQYYVYSTSNSTPGFTRAQGSFIQAWGPEASDVLFTINSSVLLQEIMGFGGSFTDSFATVLGQLPEAAQDNLMQSYFGAVGIEYSLGRLPIGSTDFSPRVYSLDDVPGDVDLRHFGLADEDLTFRIPLLKRAQQVRGSNLTLYGCPWNAPSWMKTNNNTTTGFVRAEYQGPWASYLIKWLEAYRRNGVEVWAVSGGNEVVTPYFVGGVAKDLQFILVTPDSQRTWLRNHFLQLLRQSGVADAKFILMDDMRIFSEYWMQRMAYDEEVMKAVAGLALHWYMDFISPPTMLDSVHERFPDKLILYTESSINFAFFPGPPVLLGSWDRAEAYIYDIIENFNHWTNGYIDWNLALDTTGGPSLLLSLDAAIIVDPSSGEFFKQPTFYALGHFSKFIPPGSRRVLVDSNQNLTVGLPVEHVGGFANPHEDPIPPSWIVKVPQVVICLASTNSDGSHSAIVLNSRNVSATVTVRDLAVGSVTLDVEAKSIHTFVYWLD